ncbi:MAG: hypothetical protein JWN22_1190 [Nocardioides sp.]|jgi:hypothetical protein|nr:hypothetical protein [Nocardioides sp.]
MADTSRAAGLQVRRSRAWPILWVLLAAVLVAVGAWFATHPSPLPTSGDALAATTPVAVPVYLGVFTPPGDWDRDLHVSGVETSSAGDASVAVVVLVCHGGALHVTSAPGTFCSRLEPVSGATLGAGDSLVIQVTGETPGTAEVDRVRLSYRDGVQWATQEVGRPTVVTVLSR